MKTFFLAGLGCTLLALTAAGQSPSSVRWEATRDVRNGPIDKRLYKEMVKQAQVFAAYLQDSCLSPLYAPAAWHGEFTAQGASSDPSFRCAVVGELNSQEFRLVVNDPRLLYRDSLLINNRMYYVLAATPVPRNGALYFEAAAPVQHFPPRPPMPAAMWLMVGDNMPPPYLPLTRKEYLLEAKQELEVEKAAVTGRVKQQNPIRSESQQKADKDAAIAQMEQTCTGMQLQVRMRTFLAKYQSDEVVQQEAIVAATSPIDSTLQLMVQLMTHLPAAELERPAFVSVPADAFQGFEDLSSESGMLVSPNPLYRGSAPGSILPNLFIACLMPHAANEASVAEERGRIEFLPEKLKSLLK